MNHINLPRQPKVLSGEEPRLELEGQIETITYANEDTGYTVIRLIVNGFREPVTIVGNIISPTPGEALSVKGYWTNHPKFGRQFKAESHHIKSPSTVEGIKKYLASGLIKGIGPVMAARIVEEFGRDTLDIIDHHSERLERIDGIGPKRVDMIKRAWTDQKDIRGVMIFLQSHGVGSGFAARIFRAYGNDSISVVSANPFRLAMDISGIGFNTADRIAKTLGFDNNSPARAEAGVIFVMNQLADEGHVYYPYDLLLEKTVDTLDTERAVIIKAIDSLARERKIAIETLKREDIGCGTGNRAVYLARLNVAEKAIADNIRRVITCASDIRKIDEEKALKWLHGRIGIDLASKQKEAVKRAVKDKILVITGGPGTGKTTIINAVIKIYHELGAKIALAAPTGRAAKRMSEATNYPAKTIHRLLEFSRQNGGFLRTQDRPLEVDVLIIDEVSMIDTILMHHLLRAVPDKAVLILVGDVNQLPSIGPGCILKDLINSHALPVVELKEIFRQSATSRIIINAHRINDGLIPELTAGKGEPEDFYFIEQEDPEKASDIITELVSIRIPRRFSLDPINDIQVLSPMHKGVAGTENLNRLLQETLNKSGVSLARGGRAFKLHDKVIQMRNNYDKEVFNGDIGRIEEINPEAQIVTISFDGIRAEYDYSELDEITPAYAISVHKSQGSEYPAIVLPLLNQHYVMLQRNLIYTAVTRGKKLVVIVGSKKALAMGIKNNRLMKRYTSLIERMTYKY